MLSQAEQLRYSRQILLPEIGIRGQEQLAAAKVLVIGAGGLGCPVLLYLAAAGVGTIGIMDGDRVEESNLQRQLLYNSSDTGRSKALAAQEKIQAANPYIKVNAHPFHASPGNILPLIAAYDLIVDGTDNFAARYLINDACVLSGKPWVFGSIFRFEGQVAVFNHNGGPSYRCIFPLPPAEDEIPACSAIGVPATLPGIIGTLQANEVIKWITGAGNILSGRMLLMDALSMDMQTIHIAASPEAKNIRGLLPSYEEEDACEKNKFAVIGYGEIQSLTPGTYVLIDVREPEEHRQFNIGGINIPLSSLEENQHSLPKDKQLIVYCASGMRSARAAAILVSTGFASVSSLRNGISQLAGTLPV
ncbi:MAG: HesA/MoeB/ThiF family protein [Bacteroidetes bacterium]|nr:HesA/MoeB/ThiF family protein [Bacteroidota bacterium]